MSGFRSVTLPNIAHAQKLVHTPERRHLALLEALAKRGDALGGERAATIFTNSAELVVVQTARDES